MGDFVHMMRDKSWIEGTVSSRKRPGAYCTGFEKSRTPRVYMTYQGSQSDVITLAHELGHAFHSWVMRDLPDSQRSYGMSLAETASTFGETAVRDALLARPNAAGKVPDHVGRDRGDPVVHAEHPGALHVRKVVLRKARRTPAAAGRTRGVDGAARGRSGTAMRVRNRIRCSGRRNCISSFRVCRSTTSRICSVICSAWACTCAAQPVVADFYPRYVALLRDTGRMNAEPLARQHLDAALGRSGLLARHDRPTRTARGRVRSARRIDLTKDAE